MAETHSGTSGSCTWSIDDDGNLVVSPVEGDEGWLDNENSRPWADYAREIKTISFIGTIHAPETCYQMFDGCISLETADFSNFDTSATSYMDHMFEQCVELKSLDLSNFNTSNVTSMSHMFETCIALTDLNISSFDTQNVEFMENMFFGCNSLKQLDLYNFDTHKVKDMSRMFQYCKGIKSLYLPNFNTANVTDMSYMFSGCTTMSILTIPNFDTSRVVDMTSMFASCSRLADLDISSFNTSAVNKMTLMFNGCTNLEYLSISNFQTTQASITGIFNNCTKLKTLISRSSTPAALKAGTFNTLTSNNCTLYVSEGSIANYQANSEWNFSEIEDMPADIASGITGENQSISWRIDGLERMYVYPTTGSTGKLSGNSSWFNNRSNIKKVWFLGNIESRYLSLFREHRYVTDIYFGNLRPLTNGDSAESMFEYCTSLRNIDFGNLSTSKVWSMAKMFYFCQNLQTLDLSNFDTSVVNDMKDMFTTCVKLTSVDLSSFDTSKVKDMSYMFDYCQSLQSLDLSSFDTSSVTDMSYMFSGCQNLQSLDLSNFKTDNVTTMKSMFSSCTNLQTVDFSNSNASNVTNMADMFGACSNLESVNFSNFITSSVTTLEHMFYNCPKLKSLDLSSFNTSNVTTMKNMFIYCTEIESIDVSGFDISSVTNMSNMFSYCKNLKALDLSSFKTSKLTSTGELFRGCQSLQSLDLSNFDTSKITSMVSMFYGCQSLQTLDLSNFNTSNVGSMSHMFHDCQSLQTLDLSNFDTSNVGSMNHMFYECQSLQTLDLTNFDTSNVGFMENMFSGCRSLQSLDLTNFNTSEVYVMRNMFSDCQSLQSLDLSSFDTSNVGDMDEMFSGCLSLQSLDLTNFTIGKENTRIDDIFSNCNNLTSIISYNSTPSVLKDSIFLNSLPSVNTCTLIVPKGSKSLYSTAIGWKELTAKIEEVEMGQTGSVKWKINNDGNLLVWPVNGKVGRMDIARPWSLYVDDIKTTQFTGHIYSPNSCTEMFIDCKNLTSIDFGNFDTSEATEMRSMFSGCQSLQALDLSNFNTANVTNMRLLFNHCENLRTIEMSNFDTSNVQDICYMFQGCQSLETLDLSNFDTSNTDPSYTYRVFKDCTNLQKLILGKFYFGNDLGLNPQIKEIVLKSIPRFQHQSLQNLTSTNFILDLSDESHIYTGTDKNYFPHINTATYTRSVANQWGTIVLPFDAEMGDLYDFYEVESVTDDALVLHKVTTLSAGTPALLRAGAGQSSVTITSSDVDITTNLTTAPAGPLSLVGAFSTLDLTDEEGYIISNNQFWNIQSIKGNNTVGIKPLRAYLAGTLPSGAKTLSIGYDEDTSIDALSAITDGNAEFYDLNGRRLNNLQSGVNIVKLSNGTTRKVIIK